VSPPPGATAPTAGAYFAYGSNMSEEQMRAECPRAECLGPARLAGYRLAFLRRSVRTGTGVADVVADAGAETWGVLYELGDGDWERLDRKEGRGWAYERLAVSVDTDRGSRPALVYTVKHKEASEVRPSSEYLRRILAGARARRLPAHYVRSLECLGERWESAGG